MTIKWKNNKKEKVNYASLMLFYCLLFFSQSLWNVHDIYHVKKLKNIILAPGNSFCALQLFHNSKFKMIFLKQLTVT